PVSLLDRTPSATLLPYTTLFRSQEPAAVPLWMRKGTLWVILVLTTAAFALIAYYLLPLWWARLVNIWVGASNSWVTGLQIVGDEDRKSTRLNASHVSISYAVFCL